MTTESKAVRWFRCNKVGCEHNGQVMPEHLIMCNHRDQINFAYVTPLPATEKAKVPAARAEPATTGERGNGIESRLRFIEEGANDATVAARFRECLPNIRRELAARDPLPAASPQKPNWPYMDDSQGGGYEMDAASPAAGAESQGWLADLRNEVARLTAERNLYMNRDIEHIDRMVKAETQVNLLTAELAELNDHATRTENLAIGYQREIEKALAERDEALREVERFESWDGTMTRLLDEARRELAEAKREIAELKSELNEELHG